MLCRVDNAVEVVEDVVEFGGLLFVFEAEGGLALEGHGGNDTEGSKRTHGGVEDVGLDCFGAVEALARCCDHCHIENLYVREEYRLGLSIHSLLAKKSTRISIYPQVQENRGSLYRSTQGRIFSSCSVSSGGHDTSNTLV